MKPKSLKPWIIALAVPIPLLLVTALIQTIVRSAFGDGPNSVRLVVNILSLLIGIISVLLIMGFPVWIIMLVMSSNYNSKLKQQGVGQASAASPVPAPSQDPNTQPPTPIQ